MSVQPKQSPLIVIVGETASGKSALALELAERLNGEIICADSWTVYRGFDIGTAKPSHADQTRVRHHLLDVADPADGFNAVRFQRLAYAAIADITSRKRLPIMVGGTGLYIDSVLYDYEFLPATPADVRAELNLLSIPELLEKVSAMGLSLEGIDVRNKRRIVRHIENGGVRPTRHMLRDNTLVLGVQVLRSQFGTILNSQVDLQQNDIAGQIMSNRAKHEHGSALGILGDAVETRNDSHKILRDKVTARVDAMLAEGLEREVRGLLHYGWDAEPMKGIGYREWQSYFEGEQTAEELQKVRERIIKGTMDLAKRQRTWFKRNHSIQWVSDRSIAVDIATTFLNKSN